MFASYNLHSFGQRLKTLRKAMNYTQLDISRLAGINIDTLSKIESGKVIPRYDTLELLSIALKKDLLKDFASYRYSEVYFDYYERLDNLILSNDVDKLNTLERDFEDLCSGDDQGLVDIFKVDQFKLTLKAISFLARDDYDQAMECCRNALLKSIPTFDINHIDRSKYTFFETRLLLIMGTIFRLTGDFEDSERLLTHCLDYANFDSQATFNEKLTIIKIYFNLSYNAHRIGNNSKAHKLAIQGINYCNKHHLSYMLHGLYFRKGVAEYHLGDDAYTNSFMLSSKILSATDKLDLLIKYRKIAKDMYDVQI